MAMRLKAASTKGLVRSVSSRSMATKNAAGACEAATVPPLPPPPTSHYPPRAPPPNSPSPLPLPRPRSRRTPSAAKSSAVSELIDAIVKKKGFKQLAGYSVKCLQGLLQPGRMGWEIQSRNAFELGGPRAVLDVLLKYCADGELQHFGLLALRSMVSAPGSPPVDAETLALSVQLLHSLWVTTELGDGDKAAALVEALEYLLAVARKAASAVAEGGVCDVLEAVLGKLAAGWGGDANNATLAAAVFRLVHAMTLSRDGLLAVAARTPLLTGVLNAALHVYNK